MARKTKVEMSSHFNEIHEKLAKGVSPYDVSKWLKNQFNENISPRALYRYKKKFLPLVPLVEEELNQRMANETTEKEVKKAEDKIQKAMAITKTVVTVTADNMEGILKVAADLPNKYEAMCEKVNDPMSPITEKDCAELSLKANKLWVDWNKQQQPIDVNVNNASEDLYSDEDVMRFINESKSRNG